MVFGKGVDTPYSWIVCISAFFINFFAVGSSFLVTGTLSSYWRNELCAFDHRNCTGKWTLKRIFDDYGDQYGLMKQKVEFKNSLSTNGDTSFYYFMRLS